MPTFTEDCDRLETEPEQVLEECERFRQRVISWIQGVVDEAESGIRGTPDVDLRLMGDSEYDPAVKLIAYSIALQDQRLDDRPEIDVEGELREAIGQTIRNVDFNDHPAGRYIPELETGLFGKRECIITVFLLPEKITDDINGDDCPGILRPLFQHIIGFGKSPSKTTEYQKFKMIINHEMSHAYISGQLGSDWRQKYKVKNSYKIEDQNEIDLNIKSIDEAACQAISSIIYPAYTTNIEYYQKQTRHSMADLQFFKTCFIIYSRRFDSKEEKVARIRERAVTAVNRIKKTQKRQSRRLDITKLPLVKEYGLIEAVLGTGNQKLEKLRMVLKQIEAAEKKSFYSLALLNIIEYDWENHMKNTFISRVEGELDHTVEQFVSNDGTITELVPEESKTRTWDTEERDYVEEHEFESSIYEIRQGLRELRSQAEVNNDLTDEEAERLKKAAQDVEEAIKLYNEEEKFEKSAESELREEYEEDTEKIANWIKQRVEHGEYTDPVRIASDLEVETQAIVEDYEMMVQAGIDYNQKIMNRLETLHGDEKGIKQIVNNEIENEEIDEMMTITQHVYNLCRKSTERLEEAHQKLEEANEHLENI